MPEQELNPEHRIDISDSSSELEQLGDLPDAKPSAPPVPSISPSDAETDEVQEIELEFSAEAAPYVEQLQLQLDEAIEARQRALADFSNYQRRAIENEQRAKVSGMMSVMHNLLPILDHFDLALNQDLDALTTEKLMNGMCIVRDEIVQMLQSMGVEMISPQIGDEFDPNRHEAMLKQEAEGIAPNHIVMVMQAGYVKGDMVLRPAKVAVAPGDDD